MERGNLARARMVSPGRDQSSEHIKIVPKRGVFARAKSHLSRARKNALKGILGF